ncbi:hypothetical protein K438DRAFT_2030125 [Mycena galopus ATCC 62051]|nr:hypothetical protein K438DRAFT_2030125 [Mycena galopus ATCC 62051]
MCLGCLRTDLGEVFDVVGDLTSSSPAAVIEFLARHPGIDRISPPECVAAEPTFGSTRIRLNSMTEHCAFSVPFPHSAAQQSPSAMSSRHASKLPLLEQLVLAGSPWNPDRTDPVPSTKCIAVLTSIVHLTRLDMSAVLQNDADPTLDALVRALFVPTLQYVGSTSPDFGFRG